MVFQPEGSSPEAADWTTVGIHVATRIGIFIRTVDQLDRNSGRWIDASSAGSGQCPGGRLPNAFGGHFQRMAAEFLSAQLQRISVRIDPSGSIRILPSIPRLLRRCRCGRYDHDASAMEPSGQIGSSRKRRFGRHLDGTHDGILSVFRCIRIEPPPPSRHQHQRSRRKRFRQSADPQRASALAHRTQIRISVLRPPDFRNGSQHALRRIGSLTTTTITTTNK